MFNTLGAEMSHLADYIEQRNAWARIFKEPLLNVNNLDHVAAQALADRLCSDLSPENLSCDGELDRATVQRRRTQYTGALKELQKKFNVQVEEY
jgi:hypothetical protein